MMTCHLTNKITKIIFFDFFIIFILSTITAEIFFISNYHINVRHTDVIDISIEKY